MVRQTKQTVLDEAREKANGKFVQMTDRIIHSDNKDTDFILLNFRFIQFFYLFFFCFPPEQT